MPHIESILRENVLHIVLLTQTVQHLLQLQQALQVHWHSAEAVALHNAVLERHLEFTLPEGAATHTFKLLVTERLRQYNLHVAVELCLPLECTSESADILANGVLDVDGHVDEVLAGKSDGHQVQVEFVVELLRSVGKLAPQLVIFDVEVHAHDVVVVLVDCVQDLVVEQAGNFTQLLLDPGIFYVDFLTLTCVPNYDFVSVGVDYHNALVLGVVVVAKCDIRVQFERHE